MEDSRLIRKIYGFEENVHTYTNEDSRLLRKLHRSNLDPSAKAQIEEMMINRKFGKFKSKDKKEKFLKEKHPNWKRGLL